MRCPIASCKKDVQPKGMPTGLQEILAVRIHLARDHGEYRDTQQVLELRVDEETVGAAVSRTVYVDVDRNERYLSPPPWGQRRARLTGFRDDG